MKKNYFFKLFTSILFLTGIGNQNSFAQVGVGTTTPTAALDVTSTNDGILVPRVALTITTSALPLTAPTTSEMVYNTATVNDVTPGFYYWDGTKWVRIISGINNDWTTTGNSGTTAGTNFIGTTDAIDLRIKTAATDRWNISNANSGQLQSYSLGTAALPTYSWQGDQNTGMFSSGADNLAFSTNGTEKVRINNNGAVGIGTTTPRGALEVNATTNNYGFVAPSVALTAINSQAPVTNPQGGAIPAGTVVYNTSTIANVFNPGLHYWDGTRWIAFAGSPGGLDWTLKGNGGTNAGTDFLGTTDAQDLVLKANSIERIRMGTAETVVNDNAQNYNFRVESINEQQMFYVDATNSHVHIRAASPFPTIDMFTSVGQINDYPINGYATGQGTAGIYGRITTVADATHMNAGGAFDGAGNGFTTINGWNVGVVGTATQAGIIGTATNPSNNNNARQGGYFTTTNTAGTTQSFASIAGRGSGVNTNYYGGYFTANQGTNDYAYVGIRSGGTDYGILSAGTKSTMIKDNENNNRVMFCTEAPEVLFQDFGESQLVNGKATIKLEEILSKNISEKKPVKVFIQLEGDCNGVYVTNKSNKGFTVTELNNGRSNTKFSWQIIGNRADAKNESGETTSEFDEIRLPIGPEKISPEKTYTSKSQKK